MMGHSVELPKRKVIRLQEYEYRQNGMYFVTICTHNKKMLFGDIVGASLRGRPNQPDLMIQKWLLELENKYTNSRIVKYCIMPNHIHFIMAIENEADTHTGASLQEMMDWFKTMTTNGYIKGVKNGLYEPFEQHVWQRSYYEHIIRNKESYEKIWEYIDTNPLKWELDKYYIE